MTGTALAASMSEDGTTQFEPLSGLLTEAMVPVRWALEWLGPTERATCA
ncbi:hypothetical protein GT040_12060 [Streptomyces sp. SID2119]|nr:hypothetical protein [Streptomyces sp. SID2119]